MIISRIETVEADFPGPDWSDNGDPGPVTLVYRNPFGGYVIWQNGVQREHQVIKLDGSADVEQLIAVLQQVAA